MENIKEMVKNMDERKNKQNKGEKIFKEKMTQISPN